MYLNLNFFISIHNIRINIIEYIKNQNTYILESVDLDYNLVRLMKKYIGVHIMHPVNLKEQFAGCMTWATIYHFIF